MFDKPLQTSLFEEDYLLRELGQVAHVPQVALTELVANAWDAGAKRVDIVLPTELGNLLTITDDGHGMNPAEFKKRWMTLRYNRLKYQGTNVEFPPGSTAQPRTAFGRNGVGRHGLLCFANEYQVQTWRDGQLATFLVGTDSGPSPFALRSEEFSSRIGNGTCLSVYVERHLPDATEILTVLAARFVHDPEFEVRVNGELRAFSDIEGRVGESTLEFGNGRSAVVTVIDSTRLNHSSVHQGIAFWVQHRLVGSPSWAIGQVANFDGRTRFARRYKVIVDTNGFEADVEADWSAFKSTEAVKVLYLAVAEHVRKVALELVAQVMEETSADALTENLSDLKSLGQGAQIEVAEFTKAIAQEHPTISPEFLATAVKAVIKLEKSKSGAALLHKLSELPSDDMDGLDRLLSEWSVKDALRVLDEIGSRIDIIETIRRLSGDPNTDELHTLHPLVLRARWLFGHEFESEEFCSNVTLKTVARELFKKTDATFVNDKKRPDIVVLADKSSFQMTGVESFGFGDSTLTQMQSVLLIELKKGGFELTHGEVTQAERYLEQIYFSGAISGTPIFNAWVVGEKIARGVGRDKSLKDNGREYGRVRAVTFATLVDTANRRLLKLRDALSERYGAMSDDALLKKVLSQPEQSKINV